MRHWAAKAFCYRNHSRNHLRGFVWVTQERPQYIGRFVDYFWLGCVGGVLKIGDGLCLGRH